MSLLDSLISLGENFETMTLEPIFNRKRGIMRVACFASGSGTNARKIIERGLDPDSRYRVVLLFSDVRDDRVTRSGDKMCHARDISEEYGTAYECIDIRDFYTEKGLPRSDLSVRSEFDERVVKVLTPHSVDLICNAGYMSIMTPPILTAYSGRIINVHPADLTIMKGLERKYVGIHVVEEAIMAGEKELRSTTHIVREKVDHGEILMLSESVLVKLPKVATLDQLADDKNLRERVVREHQETLKRRGDWVIYPLTVQMIAEGRFSLDNGKVYFDEEHVPQGVRLPCDISNKST